MKRVPLRRRALAAAMGAYQHLDRPAAPAQPSRPKYYTPPSGSPLQALPDDVLRRLLAGVPILDHGATAAACRAFRAVVNGPQFLALRRRYGFAEHDIVLVGCRDPPIKVRTARTSRVQFDITGGYTISAEGSPHSVSTTDGGSRLFVFTRQGDALHRQDVWVVDVSSGECRFLANLPMRRRSHCMEWHGGCLYVAGGRGYPANGEYARYLRSFQIFNEATGAWDDSPPMPHGCADAASGVIGNQLVIAGGYATPSNPGLVGYNLVTQLYDFTTRTWRVGAPLPFRRTDACGVVCDAKLFVTSGHDSAGMLVYDPQADIWSAESYTEQVAPISGELGVRAACTHNGRLVVFLKNGTARERAAAGDWSAYDLADEARDIVADTPGYIDYMAQTVLLG